MKLSGDQLEKLSNLFMDLAKGLFLASLAVYDSLRAVMAGIVFTFLSLKVIEFKEVEQ